MLNRNFFLAALLALSVSFLVAFSNAKLESNAVYEYVSIWQSDMLITINEQGKETTQEFLKKDKRSLNSSYELVNKYETQGYELFESGFNSAGVNVSWFLLRRKKQ